ERAARAVINHKRTTSVSDTDPLAIGNIAERTRDAARVQHRKCLQRRGHKAVDQRQLQLAAESCETRDVYDVILRIGRCAADFNLHCAGGLLCIVAIDRRGTSRMPWRERATLVYQTFAEDSHMQRARGPLKLSVELQTIQTNLRRGECAALQF